MSAAATCEVKTTTCRSAVELGLSGIKPTRRRVAADVIRPIKNQRLAVRVKSATGPQRNRQRLAETPSATIKAEAATEKPASVRMKGNVIEANPLLMPEGRTSQKNVDGAVDSRTRILITSLQI